MNHVLCLPSNLLQQQLMVYVEDKENNWKEKYQKKIQSSDTLELWKKSKPKLEENNEKLWKMIKKNKNNGYRKKINLKYLPLDRD